jgi:hypothetical protein
MAPPTSGEKEEDGHGYSIEEARMDCMEQMRGKYCRFG